MTSAEVARSFFIVSYLKLRVFDNLSPKRTSVTRVIPWGPSCSTRRVRSATGGILVPALVGARFTALPLPAVCLVAHPGPPGLPGRAHRGGPEPAVAPLVRPRRPAAPKSPPHRPQGRSTLPPPPRAAPRRPVAQIQA